MSTRPPVDDARASGAPPIDLHGAGAAAAPRPENGDRSVAMAPFLSLYLLLLVFFIVLVSLSAPEAVKSTLVMNSVASTFGPETPSTAVPADATDFHDREMAGQLFHKRIARLVFERLRVAKVRVVKPGEIMRISLPADRLFQPGGVDIRAFQAALLDRIVAELSARPPGLSFELEFAIGSAHAAGGDLPAGATLEVNRAGAFARTMLALGAPPNAISVALRPGDPQEVTLTFLVRDRVSIGADRPRPHSIDGDRR